MKTYYFVKTGKRIKIMQWDSDVILPNNPNFEALTPEQTAFYLANPTASIAEVCSCELIVQPTPIVPSLEDIQTASKQEISNYSASTLGKFITELQFANAQASYLALTLDIVAAGETVYTLQEATNLICRYNVIGKQCRDKYYEVEASIDASASIIDVEAIVENAKTFYDGINIEE